MNISEMFARLTRIRALMLGCFFASVYYFFSYDNGMVQATTLVAANAEIEQQKKQLQEINAKLDKAHEYQRSAAEMGEALSRLLSYIPENFRLSDFMKVISEEAKVAGLNIIRIAETHSLPSATLGEKRNEFEELTVAVELQGTFSQHMTFLSNLTRQKQIFTIEKFLLEKDRESAESESPNISCKGEIKAYRYIVSRIKS